MNRADVQMVNSQLDELGNTFLRNRALAEQKQHGAEELGLHKQQLEVEKSRVGVDQTFRDAQLQHEKNMEATAGSRVDAASLAAKQKMLESVMHMNTTGQLDDDTLESVNAWLNDDPSFGATGMQLQKPKGAPKPGKDAAVVNAVKTALDFRAQAQAEQDPDKAKVLNSNADLLQQWVQKSSTFKPADGYVSETVKPTFDMATGKQSGSTTNRTTRTPMSAPVAARPAAAPKMVRVKHPTTGQTGMIPSANLGAAQQQGYQLIPQEAVPGFGVAQPAAQ